MSDSNGGSIALDGTNGFASANNAVVDVFTPDRDTTILTLNQWQALGYDGGSFVTSANAVFTNVSAGDYTLQAGPAVNGGVASFMGKMAPTTDMNGQTRVGVVDIGALER